MGPKGIVPATLSQICETILILLLTKIKTSAMQASLGIAKVSNIFIACTVYARRSRSYLIGKLIKNTSSTIR